MEQFSQSPQSLKGRSWFNSEICMDVTCNVTLIIAVFLFLCCLSLSTQTSANKHEIEMEGNAKNFELYSDGDKGLKGK